MGKEHNDPIIARIIQEDCDPLRGIVYDYPNFLQERLERDLQEYNFPDRLKRRFWADLIVVPEKSTTSNNDGKLKVRHKVSLGPAIRDIDITPSG